MKFSPTCKSEGRPQQRASNSPSQKEQQCSKRKHCEARPTACSNFKNPHSFYSATGNVAAGENLQQWRLFRTLFNTTGQDWRTGDQVVRMGHCIPKEGPAIPSSCLGHDICELIRKMALMSPHLFFRRHTCDRLSQRSRTVVFKLFQLTEPLELEGVFEEPHSI
ncbi:hypothetical protein TNCV_3980691 [Trichonephila clavipes]|nr:hypothetical protein TNCV_3980691 [Trichonephila clavipes]